MPVEGSEQGGLLCWSRRRPGLLPAVAQFCVTCLCGHEPRPWDSMDLDSGLALLSLAECPVSCEVLASLEGKQGR